MAKRSWIGNALAVADVYTSVIGGTITVGDLFNVTINNKTWKYSAASTVANTVRDAFILAWNALDPKLYPEFREITAKAGGSGEVVLTAVAAGVPITLSVATTEANGSAAVGQTFTSTHTTTATGPNHWDNAANWAEGAVPVNNDDVCIEDSAVSILYGLSQSAVTLLSLRIASSYRGTIGLPRYTSTGYLEYRPTYLAIGATTVEVGYGGTSSRGGSDRIKLDTGTAQTSITVYVTGSAQSDGTPAFLFKGTHADNAVNIQGGNNGIGYYAGEAATVKTLRVSYRSSPNDTTLAIGDSVALTGTGSTLTQSGAVITTRSSLLDVDKTGGELWLYAAAGITNVPTNKGGLIRHESTGTLGGLINYGSYLRQNQLAPATITAKVQMFKGSSFLDPNGKVALTNGYQTVGCLDKDVTRDFGPNRNYTVA